MSHEPSKKPIVERVTHVDCFEPWNCTYCNGTGTVPGQFPQYGEIRTCPACLGQKVIHVRLTIREFRRVLERDRNLENKERERNACCSCGKDRRKVKNGATYDGGGGRCLCFDCVTAPGRISLCWTGGSGSGIRDPLV